MPVERLLQGPASRPDAAPVSRAETLPQRLYGRMEVFEVTSFAAATAFLLGGRVVRLLYLRAERRGSTRRRNSAATEIRGLRDSARPLNHTYSGANASGKHGYCLPPLGSSPKRKLGRRIAVRQVGFVRLRRRIRSHGRLRALLPFAVAGTRLLWRRYENRCSRTIPCQISLTCIFPNRINT